MKEKFTFFQSYIEAAQWLPEEERDRFLLMVVRYGIYGEDPADTGESGAARAVFEAVRPNLDASAALAETNAENGRKGGRPRKNPDESEAKATENRTETEAKATENRIETEQKPNKKRKKAEEEEEEVEVEVEQEQENNNNARVRADRNPGFADFWKAYPKKQGIGAAEKAWKKIKPSEQLLGAMLFAISKQKRSRQWREGYIPNPATWLNQRRWEDVVDDAPPQTFAEMVEGGLYDDAGNGQDFGYFADSIPASLGKPEFASSAKDLGGAAFGL